jgi:hypothetical protein
MTSAGSANLDEDLQEIPSIHPGHVDAIQLIDLAENVSRSKSSTPTKSVKHLPAFEPTASNDAFALRHIRNSSRLTFQLSRAPQPFSGASAPFA